MDKKSTRSGKPTARRTTAMSAMTQKYAATILAPLRRMEAAAATKAALATVLRNSGIRADRTRIYEPMLRIEKPRRRGGAPTRMVWVRIRDRDRGAVHEVSVATGKVVEHVLNPYGSPPFSDEEREDARRLIASDPTLGKIAARKNVDIEWFSPGDHDGKPRRVIGARLVRVQDNRVVETLGAAEVELDEGVLLQPKRGHR